MERPTEPSGFLSSKGLLMSGNSEYVQTALANWFTGTTMPSAPTTVSVALSRTSVNDSGSNIDEPPSGVGYSRQVITLTSPVHTENDGTRLANANAIIFGPVANTSWGTIVSAAIFDQSGNMLFKGDLAAPRVAPVGDTLSFGIDTIEFKVM